MTRPSHFRVAASCRYSVKLRVLVQARQLAGPPCATFCAGMGASARANSATRGAQA